MINIKRVHGGTFQNAKVQSAVSNKAIEPVNPSVKVTLRTHRMTAAQIERVREEILREAKIEVMYRQLCC